jgi:hypothetical protein
MRTLCELHFDSRTSTSRTPTGHTILEQFDTTGRAFSLCRTHSRLQASALCILDPSEIDRAVQRADFNGAVVGLNVQTARSGEGYRASAVHACRANQRIKICGSRHARDRFTMQAYTKQPALSHILDCTQRVSVPWESLEIHVDDRA